MGGTSLLQSIFKLLASKDLALIFYWYEFRNLLTEHHHWQKELLKHRYLFIDGYQILYAEKHEIIKDFEIFLVDFFGQGGKLFLKVNPVPEFLTFRNYIQRFKVHEVVLENLVPSVLEKIFNDFEAEAKDYWNFQFDQECKATLLSLDFHSYREFKNFLFVVTYLVTADPSTKLSPAFVMEKYRISHS
jgi:hypothetical protein